MQININVATDNFHGAVTCDQKSIMFKKLPSGDGVVIFPGDATLEITVEKENIKEVTNDEGIM